MSSKTITREAAPVTTTTGKMVLPQADHAELKNCGEIQ